MFAYNANWIEGSASSFQPAILTIQTTALEVAFFRAEKAREGTQCLSVLRDQNP